MASQFQMLASIQAMVNAALKPNGSPIVINNLPLSFLSAIGYPSMNTLQTIPKNGPALIAIYDRKISKNATRWSPYTFQQSVTPATLTTAISPSEIAPGETATVTLGGTVTAGDAVSCLAQQVGAVTGAVVVSGAVTDSPTSMAASLADAINVNASMSGLLTATSSGDVVTITNVAQVALAVSSFTGNGGSEQREIGRREQQVQVILWAMTVEIRNAMVEAIAEAIAESEINFGPVLPDGTQSRLSYVSDYDLEDDTLEDVYRHDFMLSVEYPVTVTDALYAVLAPVVTMQIQTQVSG